MSRDFLRSSSQYLENGAAVLAGVPLTMACWVRTDSITLAQCPMGIGHASSNMYFFLDLNGVAGGDPVQFWANTAGASTSTGFSANTWHHVCGVAAGITDRAVFLDGGGKGTNTTSVTPTGLNRTAIGRLTRPTPADYFSGRIAEAAIWNVALTDAEVADLSQGISPQFIRPQSLVAYWPLWGITSPEIDPIGKFDLTVTGATKAEHPRIIVPNTPQLWSVAGAAPPAAMIGRGLIQSVKLHRRSKVAA